MFLGVGFGISLERFNDFSEVLVPALGLMRVEVGQKKGRMI